MANSIDFTQAQALRAYVEEHSFDLYELMYFGFPTANSAMVMDGIKGEKSITQLVIGEISRRWNCNFEAVENAIEFIPRKIKTTLQKVDLSFCVQDFESNYLGAMRKKGQNPDDFPFERFILDKIISKLMSEIEVAVWQGKETVTPAVGDATKETFDGFHAILNALQTAGHTPYAMGTAADKFADFEAMAALVGDAYSSVPMVLHCDKANYLEYFNIGREKYGKYVNGNGVEHGFKDLQMSVGNCVVRYLPGFGTTDRVVVTMDDNFVVGVDAADDAQTIQVEKNHRNHDFWIDYRLGAQIALVDEELLIINDQPYVFPV